MGNYKKLTDEKLVELVRSKDQEIYIEIVSRYEDKLFRYVGYLIKDDQKSLDIVQETFIKAFINLQSFDVKKKFSSWIYRIAHNEAMNELKKNGKTIALDLAYDIPDSHDVEGEYSKTELTKMVKKCLSDLNVEYSEPLTLYYLEDKSYDEISDILRIPISTIGTRIRRAKLLMKKICQKK